MQGESPPTCCATNGASHYATPLATTESPSGTFVVAAASPLVASPDRMASSAVSVVDQHDESSIANVTTSPASSSSSAASAAVASAMSVSSPMKLSDVLKRKRGAKRGAVGTVRKSRTCVEDTPSSAASSVASPASCSMDGHDYLKSGPGSASSSSSMTGGVRSKFGFTSSASSVGSAGQSSNGTPTSTGGAAKASSFLASLNPARWGRSHNHNQSPAGGSAGGASSSSSTSPGGHLLPNVPKSLSSSQLAGNREKVKTWIREQAVHFIGTYFSPTAGETSQPGEAGGEAASGLGASGLSVLDELTRLVLRLEEEPMHAKETLDQIRAIVADSDVSSFEILHSGLVRCLLNYLTKDGPDRDDRLRLFLQVKFVIKFSFID